MSPIGCEHLQQYKQSGDLKDSTFKWIHSVFVVCSTRKNRRVKIAHSRCKVCQKSGPLLHACLECVFFGCHTHIRQHSTDLEHTLTIELTYGQIHCSRCNDYTYDAEIDAIALSNILKAKTFNRRLFAMCTWNPTIDDIEFLQSNTTALHLTCESTIGLRGLLNLGNTCFMNCIIQALIHTPLLRDHFLGVPHRCVDSAASAMCLVCEMTKLFQLFYNGSRVPIVLNEFVHMIWMQAHHMAGYQQQDAHEFLITMLDLMHRHCVQTMHQEHILAEAEAAAAGSKVRPKCPCIIDRIFTGGLQSDVVCQKCMGVSTTIDPIWDFSLDIGPHVDGSAPSTLIDCLTRFTRTEHLGSKEKIHCSNCQSYEESTKQFTMNRLPIVISFHLKRFHQTDKDWSKISTYISFPEMIDMTPFMSQAIRVESPFPIDNRYSLFAVITHVGSNIYAGHYLAYVRQLKDYWYMCNDHMITRATMQQVLESEGYLLFYHKHVLSYD